MAVDIEAVIEERERRVKKLYEGIAKAQREIEYFRYLIRQERTAINELKESRNA